MRADSLSVTVKDNADKYNSFDAVNNSDVSVGAQTGSIQLDLANDEQLRMQTSLALPKVTDIIAELLDRQAGCGLY